MFATPKDLEELAVDIVKRVREGYRIESEYDAFAATFSHLEQWLTDHQIYLVKVETENGAED